MNTCMCMYYTFGEFYIFIYFRPSKKGQMFLVQISIKRELAGAFFLIYYFQLIVFFTYDYLPYPRDKSEFLAQIWIK